MRPVLALSSLMLPLARRGGLARIGRFYPFAVALGAGGLLLYARGPDLRAAIAVLVPAIGAMSWAAGALAWSAARDPSPDPLAVGLAALGGARGLSARDQRTSRVLATMHVVGRAVAVPSVCLSLLAAFVTGRPTVGFLLSGVCVVYAALFGVVFGGLARIAALFPGGQGRVVFSACVLGPYALSIVFPATPSLVALFAGFLDHARTLGELL